MTYSMWWHPTVLENKPPANTELLIRSYVCMFRVKTEDFGQYVYCGPCAYKVIERIEDRAHVPHIKQIPVWVEDQAICYSCGFLATATRPVVVYSDRFPIEDLNRREYVMAWGVFKEDETFWTYCERCGPKLAKKIETLEDYNSVHRIYLRMPYTCRECSSTLHPAVSQPDPFSMEGLRHADPGARTPAPSLPPQEPSAQPAQADAPAVDSRPQMPSQENNRAELTDEALKTEIVVEELLNRIEKVTMARVETQRAYKLLHIFKQMRRSGAAAHDVTEDDLVLMEQRFYMAWDKARTEEKDAEQQMEVAHEQIGENLAAIVYHTTRVLLDKGSWCSQNCLTQLLEEAVNRAEHDHNKMIGEES